MFVIDQSPCEYQDPWLIPFEWRYRDLCGGARRIAYFYERPDTSTFRYRVYNMIQTLRSIGKNVGASFFGNDDKDKLGMVIEAADVIVICRARYNSHINNMITRAREKGKRVLFDVDDLIFNTDYAHLILRTLDQSIDSPDPWDHWFGMISRIGATLKMCDGAIATNKYLADRITEFSGLSTGVIPNFLNNEQLIISDLLYREKLDSRFRRTREIHIGYFSGTPTHNHDFSVVAKSLARIMREDSRIRLLVVGFLELKAGLEQFSDRINFVPLQDFVNLQRLMSLVEINIVPLVDNGFTNCKSELKYFEAAAVGTVTIATPIYSYANAITNGKNGYLATSIDWYDRLRVLIDSLDNYQEMAVAAHEHAIARYAWFNQLAQIEGTVFGVQDCANAGLKSSEENSFEGDISSV